jgi:hypothetical protein
MSSKWHLEKVASGLQADAIIDGALEALLAPKVSLGGFRGTEPKRNRICSSSTPAA